MPEAEPRTARRLVLIALGWLFVAVGALGTILPLLPTTPFLLVALWLFSMSSRRLRDRLYAHRLFGPPLRQWRDHRAIGVRAKVCATALMAGTLLYAIFAADMSWPALVGTGAIAAAGAAFVLSRPSGPPVADRMRP